MIASISTSFTSGDEDYRYGSIGGNDNGDISEIPEMPSSFSTLSQSSPNESVSTSLRDEIKDQDHSSISKSSFNLIKNVVGAGVLALPSGVAAFTDSPTGVITAVIWIIAMGAIFGYYFQVIGRICIRTKSTSYREAWEDTIGESGSLVVAIVSMMKPALHCLEYSMILADTFHSLFVTVDMHSMDRTLSLLFITVSMILPLCLMKNLNAMAPFSIFGTLIILSTAIAMGIRYFDGSYDVNQNGRFLHDLPPELQPMFGTYNGAWTINVLVFCTMMNEAFVAHYNAPRYVSELQSPKTSQRFGTVVGSAFGVSTLIYIVMTVFGFLTFGSHCDGYIVNNYSTKDPLATFVRVAIAFSVLTTYPIVFIGFRDGILDILQLPAKRRTSSNLNALTVILLCILTILAAIFEDLGMVNSVSGGTFAAAVVFLFPTLMFGGLIYNMNEKGQDPTWAERLEVKFALLLMVLGVTMGGLGVWIELHN